MKIGKRILDHARDRCVTTQDFNKLTSSDFTARLKQANLSTKVDIDDFIEKTDFDDKLKNLNKNVFSNETKTKNKQTNKQKTCRGWKETH